MPLPVDSCAFNDCYLIFGASPLYGVASLELNDLNNDGNTTRVILNHETFTPVSGVTFGVTVTSEDGSSKYYPIDTIFSAGPNAWGILQPIDGGLLGISLAMTTASGQDIEAMFINPQPLPPGIVGSTATTTAGGIIPSSPTVFIKQGSVNNGVSDTSLLSVTYQLLGGRAIETTPVPTGKETGPILTAELINFQLRSSPTAAPVTWFASQDVVMQPEMSLVVIGDYTALQLAIMVPVGPVKFVTLNKIHTG